MSDFPYDSIADYQRWSIVSDTVDRANMSVQGPAKFTFTSEAKIASAGSCFGQRLSERLPRLGLKNYIAELIAAPHSANWGTIYSFTHMVQLLARAFGKFQPRERFWLTPAGRYLDPFRPAVNPDGFETFEELEADRNRHLFCVRKLFCEIDLFVFTLGLTELWRDTRDGAVFPACPGRGRGEFDATKYEFRNLQLDEVKKSIDDFLMLLQFVNPTIRVILTVSPIPLAATMIPRHIVRTTLQAKSTLKVAAEESAAAHENLDYFASYDFVMSNLGSRKLFAADGRHLIDSVADEVTALFAESYFGFPRAAISSAAEGNIAQIALEQAEDCDEDRLLALITRQRKAETGERDSATALASIEQPIPLYFLGDSNSIPFDNVVFRLPQADRPFIGRALFTSGLYAGEIIDRNGSLNSAVMQSLLGARILDEIDTDVFRKPSLAKEDGSYPLSLMCGTFDMDLMLDLLEHSIVELPENLRTGYTPQPSRVTDVPFARAYELACELLGSLEGGIRLLQSYGFDIAVHTIAPNATTPLQFDPNRWKDDLHAVHTMSVVLNQCIADICARTGALFVNVWPDVTTPDGWRDPKYTLDSNHLNAKAALHSVTRIVRASKTPANRAT